MTDNPVKRRIIKMATCVSAFDKIIKQFSSLRDGPVVDYSVYSSTNEYMIGDIVSTQMKEMYLSLTGECGNPNIEPLSNTAAWFSMKKATLDNGENSVILNYDNMSGNTSPITQLGSGQYNFTVPIGVEILSFYMIAWRGGGLEEAEVRVILNRTSC